MRLSTIQNVLFVLLIFSIFTINKAHTNELKVGFAKISITPDLIDEWDDVNNDAQFDSDIDLWTDVNGNGKFDAVWMAGFQNKRAAQRVNDDLMVVTAVIDDGQTRIGIISADTIGLMRKFVLSIREDVPSEWGLDYIMVHATHNHEGPDTQGLWGPSFLKSGVDDLYMEKLKKDFLSTLKMAIDNLEPAEMSLALIPTNPLTPIKDKRKPIVIDDDIRAILFNRPDGSIIGSLINFGIHVELTWDKNLELTADVAGYLRRGISEGIYYDDQLIRAGLGGTTLWLTGNIGGLMTSGPTDPIYDPVLKKMLTKPSHAKARAYGYSLASSIIEAYHSGDFEQSPKPAITVDTTEIELGIENFMLSLGTLLGVIDTDLKFSLMPPFIRYLSEVAFIQLGADYVMAPQEVPHLRSQFPDKLNLMVNLANDSIGYIIPKSEWDEDAPWIYGENKETYGEIVSLGPNTAPIIHENLVKLIEESKKNNE